MRARRGVETFEEREKTRRLSANTRRITYACSRAEKWDDDDDDDDDVHGGGAIQI